MFLQIYLTWMDSQWEGSRSLSPPSGTIREESNLSVRNESVRKERRGSFEKKYQPDLYLPSASKLDKINNKREEELKLATTLLGGLADRVLSEQQSLPSSPEKRTQDNPRQVSGDAKDIEEVCGPERKKFIRRNTLMIPNCCCIAASLILSPYSLGRKRFSIRRCFTGNPRLPLHSILLRGVCEGQESPSNTYPHKNIMNIWEHTSFLFKA